VIQTLPTILGVRSSDIKTVAEVLDLHPKKLQRLLSDEGTAAMRRWHDMTPTQYRKLAKQKARRP